MADHWWTNARRYVVLFVIVCGSTYLLLANLGNQYLWSDEAQTALVSKTILTEGVPRGYDGKNFFSQEYGAEYGKNYIWRWHTWLPFYVLAGFYKVFGISTFVSRLPFALLGIGTVILTYFFAGQLWRGSRIPVIASALLAVSVPFLLLCRQCRCYSFVMFFSMLSLFAYVALLQRKRYAAVLLFVASTLLFHSLHIYVVPFFAAVLLHAVVFHRDRLKLLAAVIAVVLLVNSPWLVWFAGMDYSKPEGVRLTQPFLVVAWAWISSLTIIRYIFPLWLPVVAVIVAVMRYDKTGSSSLRERPFWEKLSLPVFFVIFNVLVIAVISPMPYFRYLAPSVPLMIILVAIIVDAAAKVRLVFAVAVVALLIVGGQLRHYLYEITHDYDGPIEGIVKYLNKHGNESDIVAVTYGDMPLKFYTKMRVVGGLTGEDLSPAINAKWIIIRKRDAHNGKRVVYHYLFDHTDWSKYRKITLDYPDITWENREDPAIHRFRTDPGENKVVIQERVD